MHYLNTIITIVFTVLMYTIFQKKSQIDLFFLFFLYFFTPFSLEYAWNDEEEEAEG